MPETGSLHDMERLDIHMVPCRIQFGDRGYLDKISITTEEFYAELENNPHHPTTSQPAPGRIHVLDSLNASMGQLAVLAAECAAAGFSIKRALRIVGEQVPETKTFALLNDLRYAVRGGRLPEWVKLMADLLRVTPIKGLHRRHRLNLHPGYAHY